MNPEQQIKELEKEEKEKIKEKYHKHKIVEVLNFGDGDFEVLEKGDFSGDCNNCLDLLEIRAKLEILKQWKADKEKQKKEFEDKIKRLKTEITDCVLNANKHYKNTGEFLFKLPEIDKIFGVEE